MKPSDKWAADLALWAIPPEILSQVEAMPWIHSVSQFTPPAEIPDSPSHQRAREALPAGGSVLDVGSGGGRASMAIAPPAASVVAVDTEQEMLNVLIDQARARGVTAQTFVGRWPDVADDVPSCDVVTCHHVVYNVADIIPFLLALNSHATRRVVLELPISHPQSNLAPLWKHFWNLDRPTNPTADDLLACALQAGLPAQMEVWVDESWGNRVELPVAERVATVRRRVCLNADRDEEIADFLATNPEEPERRVATVWWDLA